MYRAWVGEKPKKPSITSRSMAGHSPTALRLAGNPRTVTVAVRGAVTLTSPNHAPVIIAALPAARCSLHDGGVADSGRPGTGDRAHARLGRLQRSPSRSAGAEGDAGGTVHPRHCGCPRRSERPAG